MILALGTGAPRRSFGQDLRALIPPLQADRENDGTPAPPYQLRATEPRDIVSGVQWRLVEGVPEDEVRRLLSVARRRRFSRGEVVFHRDDPADSLHLVQKGRFAIKVMTPQEHGHVGCPRSGR